MSPSPRLLLPLVTLTFSLGACQSSPKDLAPQQELPKIQSSATQDGKGVPNGRSDSSQPFIRAAMEVAGDHTYGYSKENPVRVGPRSPSALHIRYLNSLRGPGGEPIEYERRGSCCDFETKNSEFGGGLLDIYRIKVDGAPKDFFIFVNMYDPGPPKVPAGLTQRRP